MLNNHRIIKQRFDINITEAGQNAATKAEFELDKNSKFVLGIAITSDRDDLLYYRGSQIMRLSDAELFPENYESKLLISGLNVAPDLRMVSLGEIACGNGKLEVWYKDTPHTLTVFAPYRVSIYIYGSTQKIKEP